MIIKEFKEMRDILHNTKVVDIKKEIYKRSINIASGNSSARLDKMQT